MTHFGHCRPNYAVMHNAVIAARLKPRLARDPMRRREFITLAAGVAAAWPLDMQAQPSSMPMIGFMSGRSPEDSVHLVSAFQQGLAESGFVEGQNLKIEFRWAQGDYDRLPALA